MEKRESPQASQRRRGLQAPKARGLIATGGRPEGARTRGNEGATLIDLFWSPEGVEESSFAPSGLFFSREFASTGSNPSGVFTRGYPPARLGR